MCRGETSLCVAGTRCDKVNSCSPRDRASESSWMSKPALDIRTARTVSHRCGIAAGSTSLPKESDSPQRSQWAQSRFIFVFFVIFVVNESMFKAVRLNAITYPDEPWERAELDRVGCELVAIEGQHPDEIIDAAADC